MMSVFFVSLVQGNGFEIQLLLSQKMHDKVPCLSSSGKFVDSGNKQTENHVTSNLL